jgi:NADH dehydrogenase (ubiquinone) 1 alpha subcomplex subunit 5
MTTSIVARSKLLSAVGIDVISGTALYSASLDGLRNAFPVSRLYHKTTTGIVGVPLNESARADLLSKVEEIRKSLDVHGIPSTSAYRQAVEGRCETLSAALKGDKGDEELEKLFGRQLEQEIKICDDELSLIGKMAGWKPWETSPDKKISVIEDGSGGTPELDEEDK